jgi:hypothetical protein
VTRGPSENALISWLFRLHREITFGNLLSTTPLSFYEPPGGFVRMTSMNKTYTPELTPEVLDRLHDYAELFRDDFRYKAQHAWSGVYLRGLLQDGERKSIEPMVARVPRPPQLLDIQDPEQALQQFVNQSPWDEQNVWKRYRRVMAGALASPRGLFIIDDTGFPKQGKHSVGVQRQYCGQLGKKANCQVAVTVHYVSPEGHFPAALRLYVPKSWTSAPGGRRPVSPNPTAGSGPRARSLWTCSTRSAPRDSCPAMS